MDSEQLQSEYTTQLQQLDTKTKLLILTYLLYLRKHAIKADFITSQAYHISTATNTLKSGITALIEQGMNNGINIAEQLAKLQFLKSSLTPTLSTSLSTSLVPTLTSTDKEKIIYSILLKSWSDGLFVNDRITLLTNKMKRITENIILQSQIAGLSASETASKLEEHFVDGGMEQRAMLRLATHTINMVKEKAFATIADKSDDVIGIHVMRAFDGSEKCEICYGHAGYPGGDGIVYLKSNGEIDVMAHVEPFHAYCKCHSELIFASE